MKKIVAVALVVLLSACAAVRVVEHNPKQTDLSIYETIDWGEAALTSNSRLSLTDRQIRSQVETELADKGYVFTATNPQLAVTWRFTRTDAELADEQSHIIDISTGDTMAETSARDSRVFSASRQDVTVDQLILSFSDATTKEPLYVLEVRTTTEEGYSDEHMQNTLIAALDKALAKVPARK